VDPVAFRVLKAGQPVAVEPKAFEVLLFLVENPARLVGKQEILDRVWPDTVVTESAMTRVIADLRKALGDSAHGARYIETVPTKGYRFIADVHKAPDETAVSSRPSDDEPASTSGRLTPHFLWYGAGAAALVALLVGLGALRREAPPAARPAASPHVRQVTDSLGLDLYPSFSPDGAQFAYASERGGGFEIFVRQLAAGGREIQITSDGHDNLQPAWSPTGREIAFSSQGLQGVWLVPALGGAPRRLTDFGSHPAWSPDGTTIVFQSSSLGDVWAGTPAGFPPSSLFMVAAAGGAPVSLTRPGSPPGGHGGPCFSPDGGWIAFATWGDRLSELWRVSRDGKILERVAGPKKGLDPTYFEPAFSPRGDWLYFGTSEARRNFSLNRCRVPARSGEAWGDPEQVGVSAATAIRYPVVLPGGNAIAYSALSNRGDIASLPIDPVAGTASGLPAFLTRTAGCRSTVPMFSPDGSRIAFLSCRLGGANEIWVMDANGSHAEPVTTSPESCNSPSWFPDGKRVAFLSTRGGATTLLSVTLSDRRETRILDLPNRPTCARVSPDGKRIAFSADSGGARCAWVMPIEGGESRQLTFGSDSVGFPSWSPDGRLLTMSVDGPGRSSVIVLPATGGEMRVLRQGPGESYPHGWSPDGTRIAFTGQRDGLWNIYWISRNGGPEHRLTDYRNRHAITRYPAWSPRGDQIVYEVAETTGNIWLMDLPR